MECRGQCLFSIISLDNSEQKGLFELKGEKIIKMEGSACVQMLTVVCPVQAAIGFCTQSCLPCIVLRMHLWATVCFGHGIMVSMATFLISDIMAGEVCLQHGRCSVVPGRPFGLVTHNHLLWSNIKCRWNVGDNASFALLVVTNLNKKDFSSCQRIHVAKVGPCHCVVC